MGHRNLSVVMLAIGLLSTGCTPNDAAVEQAQPASSWPPRLGQLYPDLQLSDASGNRVQLSDYSGKVLLIEPIGVDCPACQAFAGAHREGVGPLRNCTPQQNLQSIEEYAEERAGVSLDDPRLVYVQLLLYNWTRQGPPTQEEAREWAEHFGADRQPNHLVLIADPEMIGPASYAMVPGFQLVDTDFVLRFDSTGHNPHHNLWIDLLPELPALLDAVPVGHAVGQAIGDFTLRSAAGQEVSFSELRGSRPAFLYFFSGCCGHCSAELPKITAMADELEMEGKVIVGVQYLGNGEACRRIREDHGLPGTLLADSDGALCGRFGVGDFTVFEVDAAGFIRYRGDVDTARG